MQRLEVSGAVRPLYGSLGVRGLIITKHFQNSARSWASLLFKVMYPYLLTPCCRVLLEKLTGLQLVKKLPEFYGTRRFITALTNVRHLSLSWASPIQSSNPVKQPC